MAATNNSKQILKSVGIKLKSPKPNVVKIVEDIKFPLMSLLEDLKNMPVDARINHLFSVFGPNFTKLNFDKRRVLFTPVVTGPPKKNENVKEPFIYAECGGTMIDYINCKLISVAPSPISSVTFGNVSNKYNYHVVYHGTQLTMYWDQVDGGGKWCLQSANGIDVSANNFRGIDFKDAFAECLAEMKYSLDDYDKNSCHTFVIRHPKLHPLEEEINIYAKLLVSVKLSDITDSVRLYKLRNNIENINKSLVDLQVKDDFGKTVKNYREFLFKIKQNAIDEYVSTGATFFGIVARSKNINEKYPAGITVMIESDLQKALRKCVYNIKAQPGTDIETVVDLTNWIYQNEEYLALFPKKKEVFDHFEKHFLPSVVDKIFANDSKDSIQEIRIKLLNTHPGILTTEHARANVLDLIRGREFCRNLINCVEH